jgi:hypothetical protein
VITYYGPDEFLWAVLQWDGPSEDFRNAMDLFQIEHTCPDDDTYLMVFSSSYDGRTSGLLLERGEKLVLTPLGWLHHDDEIEELLENVLGERT